MRPPHGHELLFGFLLGIGGSILGMFASWYLGASLGAVAFLFQWAPSITALSILALWAHEVLEESNAAAWVSPVAMVLAGVVLALLASHSAPAHERLGMFFGLLIGTLAPASIIADWLI